MKYRTHNCGQLRKGDIGTTIKLAGWVDSVRQHGKVSFLNLRDRYGITQVVAKDEKLLSTTKDIGHEYILAVTGNVVARPEGMTNAELPTGEIDVEATQIDIVSRSNVPPFVITDDVTAKDELRLKYRYLDLRRAPMQDSIVFKSRLYQAVRTYLHEREFVDIETPILGRSTPEGARDFLVPSRLHAGEFYSLVQSPQVYKQLLIIAGFDKYYQLARCLRDEDQRKDRQLEFTQLDIELAFVEEEDVLQLTESLMQHVFSEVMDTSVSIPFDRMTYKSAIDDYGTDKPDTRYGFKLNDVTDIGRKSEFRVFKEKEHVKCLVLPKALSRKEIGELETVAKGYGMLLSWLKFTDDGFSGPIGKFFSEELLKELKPLVGTFPAATLFFAAGDKRASLALGGVRTAFIANHAPFEEGYKFVWVTDIPMFELDEATNQVTAAHHPFVMPKDPKQLENDPESVIGRFYDLVLNGVELGSGSIRVHIRELQEKIMEIIGFTKEQRTRDFGCLLEALDYGPPPHGGIALGLDRLAITMLNKSSIQDVIAFPKTLTGLGLLEGIPSPVDEKQLKEAHIKIEDRDKEIED
jgi:aspartyl-tRNA synthetase